MDIISSREQPVRRSSVLVIVLSVLLVGVCSCAVVFFVIGQHAPRLCLSEECVSTASRINAAMDRTVEPCHDFYQFACGRRDERNLNEEDPSWDWLEERVNRDLRILLEEGDNEGLPKNAVKVKALYEMCMNTESDGLMPIKEILELIGLPSYPPGSGPDLNNTSALNGTSVNGTTYNEKGIKRSWQTAAGRARRFLGLNILIGLHVTEDIRNTSRNILVVGRGSLELSDLSKIEDFTSVVHRFDPETDAEQFTKDILEFSTKLLQITIPSEESKSDMDPINEVQWGEYLKEVFQDTEIILSPNDDDETDLPYLQNLAVMLNATDNVIIEKFIWWSVFSKVRDDLGFTFSDEVFEPEQTDPRWKDCTTYVNDKFGMALSYLYVMRHFDQNSREKATAMLKDVTQAFSEAVNQLDWMDNSTRYNTLNKLKAIRNFVGSPSLTEMLETNDEDTDIVEGKLFETHLKLINASVKKNLESLREKPDRNRWITTPTTINAFYWATMNSVTFPAVILQPPVTGNGIDAINYGSLGATMGHEITHGFDNQGIQFDENGNFNQLWSAASLEHYNRKVQCIIDQYNQYQVPGDLNKTVDGTMTQGENIADNGGLRAALHAYNLFSSRNASIRRDRLPSMEQYTPQQLFFLGFAQSWCSSSTDVPDEHSPNKIRVIGTLSNSKEFSEAWSCPVGSPMNPEDKCVLW